ncbi:hypothetical protein ALC62_00195, partial [Cyphomyrmex costatus]
RQRQTYLVLDMRTWTSDDKLSGSCLSSSARYAKVETGLLTLEYFTPGVRLTRKITFLNAVYCDVPHLYSHLSYENGHCNYRCNCYDEICFFFLLSLTILLSLTFLLSISSISYTGLSQILYPKILQVFPDFQIKFHDFS